MHRTAVRRERQDAINGEQLTEAAGSRAAPWPAQHHVPQGTRIQPLAQHRAIGQCLDLVQVALARVPRVVPRVPTLAAGGAAQTDGIGHPAGRQQARQAAIAWAAGAPLERRDAGREVQSDLAATAGTTHVSVIGADGAVVSMTTTNGAGGGVLVPGIGVHLNNML
ncbi:MAG: hypothetical protein E6Q91_01690, partial [Actinobacteria bacterium]